MNEPFWINDPGIIYKNINFNLLSESTYNAKLNILTRFIIIVSILLYLLDNNNNLYIILGLICIICIILINKMCKKETFNELQKETFNELQKEYKNSQLPLRESDYFNSTNNINNPLKNINITKYGEKPKFSDSSKSTDLNKYINNKFFQTTEQYLFDTNCRQYHTMPNNKLPNEQGNFANWLYGTTDNCKSDSIYAHRLGHTIENKKCDTALNIPLLTNEGQIN